MAISIITKEDLQQFKIELLEGIKELLLVRTTQQKLWLRTSEVKELLNISSGTLQNLHQRNPFLYEDRRALVLQLQRH